MKTLKKRLTRKEYINIYIGERQVKSHEIYLNMEIYILFDEPNTVVLIFEDKKQKPSKFLGFKTPEQAEHYINERKSFMKNQFDIHQESIENGKQEAAKIQVGTILFSQWGYEQTNVNFYQVTFRKGTIVVLQEIMKDRRYEQDYSGYCTPRKDIFVSEPFQKRITKDGRIRLSSSETACIYDDKEKYFSTYA